MTTTKLVFETLRFPENIYEAMRFAAPAMCEEETRPYLQGLHFDSRADGLWLLATDGYRMHATKLTDTKLPAFKWRIGTQDVRRILADMRAKKVRAKTALRIDFAAGQVTVGASRYAMHNDHGRLNFQRILPRETKPLVTFSHTIDLKDFLAAAKHLTRGAVRIERGPDDATSLSCQTVIGKGEGKATMALTLTEGAANGEGFKAVGVNSTYLADAFAALGWGYVSVKGDPDYGAAPMLIERRTTSGPERYCVIMPMRI